MNIKTILIALIVFSVITAIHEFGHFIVAKMCKVKVNEFAIGMGPCIFSRQLGETKYSLRLFPIGGYCSMEGEDATSDNERAFTNKKPLQRFLVLVAGATMNIVLGFALIIAVCCMDKEICTNVVGGFRINSSSTQCGLQEGDEIVKIDNMPVFTETDISYKLLNTTDDTFDLTVKRNGEKVKLNDVKFYYYYYYYYYFYAQPDENGNQTILTNPDDYTEEQLSQFDHVIVEDLESITDEQKEYIALKKIATAEEQQSYTDDELAKFLKAESTFDFYINTEENTVFGVLGYSLKKTVTYSRLIVMTFIDLLRGKYGIKDMSGPIGVIDVIGDATESGLYDLLVIIIVITINVGVFNLLPLPALDGGRIVFVILEAIRKKPVPPEAEGIVHFVGFALLMLLTLIVTFSDISKLFSK